MRGTFEAKPSSASSEALKSRTTLNGLASSQLIYQGLQSIKVSSLMGVYIVPCRIHASGNAAAMKCQFTCKLIKTAARPPTFDPALRQCVERGTHPAQN